MFKFSFSMVMRNLHFDHTRVCLKLNHGGFIFLFVLLFLSCEREFSFEGCFKSSGPKTSETRLVGSYDSVLINDVFDVCLVNDTSSDVIIKAGQNIIPYINTTIKNNTLILENTMHCRWMNDYDHPVIYVPAKGIRQINLNKASRLFSNDTIDGYRLRIWALADYCEIDLVLNYDELRLKSSHATIADIRLQGYVRYSVLWAFHGCRIDASELTTKSTLVKNHSIGDFKVFASRRIEANLYSSGNIYYTGNPGQVELVKSESTGKLINVDE